MRSMTGQGLGTAPLPLEAPGTLEIELRTVNHRFLDVRVRTPRDLGELAPLLELLARESLSRGRVDVALRAELHDRGDLAGHAFGKTIDHARAKAAYAELVALRDEIAPGEPVPLSLLSSVPGVFAAPLCSAEVDDALRTATRAAFASAMRSLAASRLSEGTALAADLHARLARISTLIEFVATRAPEIVEHHRKRLRERAERMRAAVDLPLDDARLEAEVVAFAERADIAEELVRLRLHAQHMTTLLGADQGAIGRRLEFLLQEMQREANTAAAKSADAAVSHAVVDIKAEFERMREQVQNVE